MPNLALWPEVEKRAVISDCGRYRYTLERRWDPSTYPALFIMLNPSTADAEKDDPTIRRCMGFARRWGYGGLLVWNLYAYRATDPAELDRVDDPIGSEDHLYGLLDRAGIVVAAWGAKPNRGRYAEREQRVTGDLMGRAFCLGTTKDGHPRHPLYVKADAELVPFGLAQSPSDGPSREG